MDAQSALDALLCRLTSVLVNEAQLLGGLRSDVEFINDEMKSMNGLLMHLTESQHRDHQVRAWMEQVVGLSRDCEGNVELYIRYVLGAGANSKGPLGYLRRILQFVRTIPARHRVATRIRELKFRARDVGERRLRYGVTVPSVAVAEQHGTMFVDMQAAGGYEDEEDIRSALLEAHHRLPDEEEVRNGVDRVMGFLTKEAPAAAGGGKQKPRVFAIAGDLSADIVRRVYDHRSVVSSFGCRAYAGWAPPQNEGHVWRELLEQVAPLPVGQEDDWNQDEARELIKKLWQYLKGKRFLIVLGYVKEGLPWNSIISALLQGDDDCSPASAIIISTLSSEVAKSYSADHMFEGHSIIHFMRNRAEVLITGSEYCRECDVREVFEECRPDTFAEKMFLHLLYVNHNRTKKELKDMTSTLEHCKRLKKSVAQQMIMFCYKELPSKYRNVLLYLAIFPKYHIMRRTSLARRWIAEGLITAKRYHVESATDGRKHRASTADEAYSYFDMLVTRGFILPTEISDLGNIKSCTVHHEVHEFITKIARDVNFVDTNLPPDLACHLSIQNRIELRASHSSHPVEADGNDIVVFLPYLSKSSQWQVMKLLDLEGCKGLKKKHLKSICRILLLKYLSLRNTDITELPKQIQNLQCLETLDIRQTMVRAFTTNSIMLPMLKHLLAGQTYSPKNNSDRFQESFKTVRLPSGIQRMEKLEILSYVEVSQDVNNLIDVGKLLHLRKLGVILHGKKGELGLLFKQIEKLHGCLCSLSIRINRSAKSESTHDAEVVALASPPKFLRSLNISGFTGGLPLWIVELEQLTKITLSDIDMGNDALRIIGKLRSLCCIRLRRMSYTRSKLRFMEEEFQQLKSLVVEGSDITNITFDAGAAPKLEMIVWSFASMDSLSGLEHLPKLKKLELNGDCNPETVRKAVEDHPNNPKFEHNPHHQQQETGILVAASTP